MLPAGRPRAGHHPGWSQASPLLSELWFHPLESEMRILCLWGDLGGKTILGKDLAHAMTLITCLMALNTSDRSELGGMHAPVPGPYSGCFSWVPGAGPASFHLPWSPPQCSSVSGHDPTLAEHSCSQGPAGR